MNHDELILEILELQAMIQQDIDNERNILYIAQYCLAWGQLEYELRNI